MCINDKKKYNMIIFMNYVESVYILSKMNRGKCKAMDDSMAGKQKL